MSNIFRESESFGKSDGKKWSQNLKNAKKGCKIAVQKNIFFANLGLINHYSLSQSSQDFEVPFKRLFSPHSQSWMSNTVRDSESLGKSNGRSGLRIKKY